MANHYSIMGAKQWASLMLRHKFQIQVATDFSIELVNPNATDEKNKTFYEKNLVFVIKKCSDEEFLELQKQQQQIQVPEKK